MSENRKKKKKRDTVGHRNPARRTRSGVRHVSDTDTTPKMACPCNLGSRGGTISCPMSVLGDKAILGGRALGKASSASSNHSLVRDDAALGGMPFAMILSGGPGEGSSMK